MKLREMDEDKRLESSKTDEALLRRRFNRRVDGRRLRVWERRQLDAGIRRRATKILLRETEET